MTIMLATFALAVGDGHASVHVDVSRSTPVRARLHAGVLALILVAPAAVLLAAAALANATGNTALDLGRGLGEHHLGLAVVIGCPLVAMVILAASRLRIGVERQGDVRRLIVRLQLNRVELVAAVVGLLLLGFFAAHLVADAYACANGVTRTC